MRSLREEIRRTSPQSLFKTVTTIAAGVTAIITVMTLFASGVVYLSKHLT